MPSTESEIRALLDNQSEAMRTKDIERLLSVYPSDVVYFVARWFSRASGTLTNGREAGVWVRVSNCCQRLDNTWLITLEHVSVPVDLASGTPALDLVP